MLTSERFPLCLAQLLVTDEDEVVDPGRAVRLATANTQSEVEPESRFPPRGLGFLEDTAAS